MSEALQSSLAYLREHLIRTETAIDALQAVVGHGQIQTAIINQALEIAPPARLNGKKGRGGAAKTAIAEKGPGKREQRRAQIRELHATGKTPAQIAKALKVTEGAINQQIKKLGLNAAAPVVMTGSATTPAAQVMTINQVAAFLKEIGARCVATPSGYELEGKKADDVALLEHANAWRRRNNQPLFQFKR